MVTMTTALARLSDVVHPYIQVQYWYDPADSYFWSSPFLCTERPKEHIPMACTVDYRCGMLTSRENVCIHFDAGACPGRIGKQTCRAYDAFADMVADAMEKCPDEIVRVQRGDREVYDIVHYG